jgi:hypothetical protein
MQFERKGSARQRVGAFMLAVVSAGVLSLTQVAPAAADDGTGGVNVGANITTGNPLNKPTIECSWIVGDHNANGGRETEQYNYPTNSVLNPTGANLTQSNQTPTYLSGPTAPSFSANAGTGTNFYYLPDGTTNSVAPCDLASGATEPSMAKGSQSSPTSSGVAFTPNAFDSATGSWVSDPGPQPKRVELWAAVDYATNVIFDVFYPNGTEDTELGGVMIGGTQACANYNQTGSLLNSMYSAAGPAGNNEVSAMAWENASSHGIVDHCNKGQKALWHQAFTISKDDPSGTYTVEVRAISTTGTDTSWLSFKVLPFIALAVDFSAVAFANNNSVYEISGDTVWSPNANSSGLACDPGAHYMLTGSASFNCDSPTVINGGNEGMQVGVAYQPLTTNLPGSNYLIGGPVFDANLAYNGSTGLSPAPMVNAGMTPGVFGPTTWLSNNGSGPATGPQLVCPNDDPELDLSLHPTPGTVQGNYTGTMQVLGRADPIKGTGGCLTDNGAPYIVSLNGSHLYKSVTDQDLPALTRAVSGV